MFGLFKSNHEDKLLKSLTRQFENTFELPYACQIIVAENIDIQYSKTLKYFANNSQDNCRKHTREICMMAGKKIDEMSLKIDDDIKVLCKFSEHSLIEAVYHCLYSGSTNTMKLASEKIMEFIISRKSQKTLYISEINEILND